MKCQLGNGLHIDHDGEMNWRLVRTVTREGKKGARAGETYESEEVVGYYGSLEGLVKRLLDDRYADLGTFPGVYELAEAIRFTGEIVVEDIRSAMGVMAP